MLQLKLGNIQVIFPNIQIPRVAKKKIKDNKGDSLHLTLKTCLVICPWTLSVPQSSQFSLNFGNCALLGTDNVHQKIFEHMFPPNGG